MKAGHAERIEVNNLFPDIHLERLKEVRDSDSTSLCLESVLWAHERLNHSTMTANSAVLSLHKIFFGGRPPMPVLPFCNQAYHRLLRRRKIDYQACSCFLLNLGQKHQSGCFKVMEADTRIIVLLRDVAWHQPRVPLISPAPTVGSGNVLLIVWCQNTGVRGCY